MVICKSNVVGLNAWIDMYVKCGIILKSHRHVCKMGALEEGMDIHQRVVENGLALNIMVWTALIDMYAKCETIHKA